MADENNNRTLTVLTVTAAPREGGQSLTVVEPVQGNDLRRYKVTAADARPVVEYDTACVLADGWLDVPADGAVSGVEGQVATVVELTNSGALARGKGEAVLPAPTSTDTGEDDAGETDVPASGVLDLRPPSESMKSELCRLGLEYSSTDAAGVESWRDYQRGVLATFDRTAQSVTITDVKTNLSAVLSLDEVRKVTRIDTMTAAD